MICIGGVKSMLGGPEVLVGMSKDSIIHIRVLFFDVRLPLDWKECTQLATNWIKTVARKSHPELLRRPA